MNSIDLDKYCHFAMLATSPRGMSPKDLETYRRTSSEWACEYSNMISMNDLCELIIKQVEHNLNINWYDKSDLPQVARYTGFFTYVALKANLANDFEEVFTAAFSKLTNSYGNL